VVVEEVLRGRLNVIRAAQSGTKGTSIVRAYASFEQTFADFRSLTLLPFTEAAETQYQLWRKQRCRGGTLDLRIAATCVAHGVRLVSRNRRDFEELPGLDVEFWE